MPLDQTRDFGLHPVNDTRKLAVEMGKDGCSPMQVARKLNVRASLVYGWFRHARDHGEPIPFFGGTPATADPQISIEGEIYYALAPIAAKHQITVAECANHILASALKSDIADTVIPSA